MIESKSGRGDRETHLFCVAPMMAWTDRHARYFLRLISKNARLYTEMVPLNGLLKGDPERFLPFDPNGHPVALQLGGADPGGLAEASRIGAHWGYDEINLNVGCPSDRVSSGHFGACLMAEPNLVADCVSAMSEAVSIPVTVKCRIGIDDMSIDEPLDNFAALVNEAGCQTLIVHARKAWLNGLSPKENRTKPPLDYQRVYRLKRDFPSLQIVINGGIQNLDEAQNHLENIDGVMMGRAAYEYPFLLAGVDQRIFGLPINPSSRVEILERFIPYCENELAKRTALHHMTRHILGIFSGCYGARSWRRHLSTEAVKPGANISVVREALEFVTGELTVA